METKAEADANTACPYCLAEIPAAARKCRHCGEWVVADAESTPPPARGGGDRAPSAHAMVQRFFGGRNLDETLTEGVKLYVGFRFIVGVIAFVVALIFLFAVILPSMNETRSMPLRGPVIIEGP